MYKEKSTSLTFRILKKLRLINDEERYGSINPFSLLFFVLSTLWRRFIFNFAFKAYIFEFLYKKNLRPAIWRRLGCKVGKNVHIGHQVRLDFGNADRITVEDDVLIANGVTLLCHIRDMKNYHIGMKVTNQPLEYGDILLGKGCYIGLNVTILPGVSIGEGAVIGSCALVTKDVPAWTIATGVPARVVREVEK